MNNSGMRIVGSEQVRTTNPAKRLDNNIAYLYQGEQKEARRRKNCEPDCVIRKKNSYAARPLIFETQLLITIQITNIVTPEQALKIALGVYNQEVLQSQISVGKKLDKDRTTDKILKIWRLTYEKIAVESVEDQSIVKL
mmetsp:Transcript_42434/g.49505  ORF Transcript_42434/g.49505 Transcript_42434/m.49505 type:complete len:139 (+) Transcript_42434:559-975(+)